MHSSMIALSPRISLKCSKKSQILQYIQVENQRTNIVLRSTQDSKSRDILTVIPCYSFSISSVFPNHLCTHLQAPYSYSKSPLINPFRNSLSIQDLFLIFFFTQLQVDVSVLLQFLVVTKLLINDKIMNPKIVTIDYVFLSEVSAIQLCPTYGGHSGS